MQKEALRYLKNAKEILKTTPVEDDTYINVKPVQEACGTAYLAVLKAIDEYLVSKGLSKKELPKSTEAYREAIKEHLSVHNGKLAREFEKLYDLLHIAGYYRGLLWDTDIVKDAFNKARVFIEKIPK